MDVINILFASDIHGNKIQYDNLFEHASKNKFDLLILGGDITPKDKMNRTPEKQEEFLKKYLFKKIIDFNKKNKTRILVILGNDDFKSNEELLEKNQKIGYEYIGNKNIPYRRIKLVGYSYVPITPFKYKDWEKHDLNERIENRTDAVLKGIINNYSKKEFILTKRNDTIEQDLNRLKIDNKTILISHAPPYNTNLDMTLNKRHLGSEALRKIITEKKPILVLCGHIHETVKMSGNYRDTIGKSICVCTGNDYLSNNISMIEIVLYKKNLEMVLKRVII
jgi:hypothetical protein